MALHASAPKLVLMLFLTAASIAPAAAQNIGSDQAQNGDRAKSSTGTTNLPSHQEHKEQQPQGGTGPLDTTTGGAPPDSVQGDTPAGMQAAPEGSSKTIKGDSK